VANENAAGIQDQGAMARRDGKYIKGLRKG
jgi:hypothetical protein